MQNFVIEQEKLISLISRPQDLFRIQVTQSNTISNRIEKVGFPKRMSSTLLALKIKRYAYSPFQLCIPKCYSVRCQLRLGS